MSVPTAVANLLKDALIEWRDDLIWNSRETAMLTPGELVAGLQDICIQAKVMPNGLPRLLQNLRTQAIERDRTLGMKPEAAKFLVSGIVHTINRSIGV